MASHRIGNFAVLACLAAACHGISWAAADDPADVVARVGQESVSRAKLEAVLRRNGFDRLVGEEPRMRARAAAIEQLVDELLLRSELRAAGIEPSNDEINASVGRIRDQLSSRGTTLAAFLEESGRDERTLREQLGLEIGLQRLVAPLIKDDALDGVAATKRREVDGTLLRVSHILLRPDLGRGDAAVPECVERAQGVRRQILQGRLSFADAARKYSVAPSRHRGGELGFVPRHGGLNEEFARQVFTLAKGDVSKPFLSPFGVHVVTVTAVEPGRLDPEQLKTRLLQIVAAEKLREIVTRARERTTIDYAAGVPHFGKSPPEQGDAPPPVLVSDGASPSPGAATKGGP